MNLEFVKMSGAGNDFIVLDNLQGSLDPFLTRGTIRTLCRRRMSVGADGLIELRRDPELPFRMKYYNSDGKPAEMCGNGGRCIAVFAATVGLVEREVDFHFRSDAGIHRARVLGDGEARIWMTEPVVHFLARDLQTGPFDVRVSFLDTGVPHAVIIADDPETPDFITTAPLLRRHEAFGTAGANVDYLWSGTSIMRIRTWERGVEGETLACGTGAVACALCARDLLGARLPLDLRVESGKILTVGMDEKGWWLQGEAREVYSGILRGLPAGSLTEDP